MTSIITTDTTTRHRYLPNLQHQPAWPHGCGLAETRLMGVASCLVFDGQDGYMQQPLFRSWAHPKLDMAILIP